MMIKMMMMMMMVIVKMIEILKYVWLSLSIADIQFA